MENAAFGQTVSTKKKNPYLKIIHLESLKMEMY